SRNIAFRQMRELDVERASRWITKLLSLPEVAGATQRPRVAPGPGGEPALYLGDVVIPAGRYALRRGEACRFYRLWLGDRGGWKLYQRAGDDEHPMSYNASRS